jgi:hypothetical protein
LLDTLTSAAVQTAANTGKIANQNQDLLSRIFGMGPRAELLTTRLLFGRHASFTINIAGGDAASKQVAKETAAGMLAALRVPHTITVS